MTRPRLRLRHLALLVLAAGALLIPPGVSSAGDKPKNDRSDLNDDGVVDYADLGDFASSKLGLVVDEVDWCQWIKDNPRYDKHYYRLFEFIRDHFSCGGDVDRLVLTNPIMAPTRLARGPAGEILTSDSRIGSVFIYSSTLQPRKELRGFETPLGLAMDAGGNIYVGDDARDRVEKFAPDGKLLATFGVGTIKMPNDLTFDGSGNLYVADSAANVVWVFAADGRLIRTVREGGLDFPVAVEVAYRLGEDGSAVGELFVADKKNYQIKVYDLEGKLQRTFGAFPSQSSSGGMGMGMGFGGFGGFGGGTTWNTDGKFVALQSLAMDGQGRLHVLDPYLQIVQILDPADGSFISSYGTVGSASGEFRFPLDILITGTGHVLCADPDNRRVEVIHSIAGIPFPTSDETSTSGGGG